MLVLTGAFFLLLPLIVAGHDAFLNNIVSWVERQAALTNPKVRTRMPRQTSVY